MQKNIFETEVERFSVFKNRDIITPSYTPDKLLFRENQLNEMTRILGPALSRKKTDNIFIYGKVGTGKTACAKYMLQQLIEFAVKKNSNIAGTYINCRTHNSKYRVLIKAVKDFYPEQNFLGFSAAFIHEKLMDHARQGKEIVIVLDEIDKVKDLDDLIYSLTRSNNDLEKGSISVIGISNNLTFKDRLDSRTKSSLCEQELVFPAYNAKELQAILKDRTKEAFQKDAVDESAISLAAAIAAQESGDARTAVMLLLRAGEIADKKELAKITDEEVRKAKKKVEEEIIYNMVSTLPDQQQLLLYSIAALSMEKKPLKKITGEEEKGTLYSGEVYEHYSKIAKKLKENVVSTRWYRQYINELEMYGLILTTSSGKGVKGQTRFIKLASEPKKIKELIEKQLVLN